LLRPDRWEQLLDPVLHAVTAEFASTAVGATQSGPVDAEPSEEFSRSRGARLSNGGHALERAWKELGSLRPDVPRDLDRIVAAASSPNSAARQVAARLLVAADADVAEREWGRLLDDPNRSVRRAAVDAMVDAERPALRPLLERALGDADAWTRWKALRGLVDLGVDASRAAVSRLIADPDFRVRLEATTAMRRLSDG
jgi:HEAT repeat protein